MKEFLKEKINTAKLSLVAICKILVGKNAAACVLWNINALNAPKPRALRFPSLDSSTPSSYADEKQRPAE